MPDNDNDNEGTAYYYQQHKLDAEQTSELQRQLKDALFKDGGDPDMVEFITVMVHNQKNIPYIEHDLVDFSVSAEAIAAVLDCIRNIGGEAAAETEAVATSSDTKEDGNALRMSGALSAGRERGAKDKKQNKEKEKKQVAPKKEQPTREKRAFERLTKDKERDGGRRDDRSRRRNNDDRQGRGGDGDRRGRGRSDDRRSDGGRRFDDRRGDRFDGRGRNSAPGRGGNFQDDFRRGGPRNGRDDRGRGDWGPDSRAPAARGWNDRGSGRGESPFAGRGGPRSHGRDGPRGGGRDNYRGSGRDGYRGGGFRGNPRGGRFDGRGLPPGRGRYTEGSDERPSKVARTEDAGGFHQEKQEDYDGSEYSGGYQYPSYPHYSTFRGRGRRGRFQHPSPIVNQRGGRGRFNAYEHVKTMMAAKQWVRKKEEPSEEAKEES